MHICTAFCFAGGRKAQKEAENRTFRKKRLLAAGGPVRRPIPAEPSLPLVVRQKMKDDGAAILGIIRMHRQADTGFLRMNAAGTILLQKK